MDLLTRSRAQQFDDALTGELSASGPPAPASAVSAERALALRLRATGADFAPVPTPEFREALRTRLMAVAAVQGIGAPAPAPLRSAVSWRVRAASVGAGVMATVVAASGVAVAGSRSLPGDPFYGVKRTAEALQLRAADDERAEGTRHLQFAATRLREVRALVLGRDAPADAVAVAPVSGQVGEHVAGALFDMDSDTRDGLRLLTASFRASRSAEPLEELRRFALAQGEGLRTVLPALHGSAQHRAEQSLVLLEGVRTQADELLLLLDCTAVCDPAQVAPVAPVPGAPAAPCDCPSPVPPPQTAPAPPPAPQGTAPAAPDQQPPPGDAGEPSEPSSPPSSPPPSPPPSSPEPPPPLPSPPALPTLPPLPPVPTLEQGSDTVLPGLVGRALPALVPGAGPLAVGVRALLSRVVRAS